MKKSERIKLLAFDVDGTLTPGCLVMGEYYAVSEPPNMHVGATRYAI